MKMLPFAFQPFSLPSCAMFNSDWLNERYRFDAEARNEWLEANCVNYFAYLPKLRLLDLGSGTGSNVRYYIEAFPQDQHWTCVEHDPKLIEASRQTIAADLRSRGYREEASGDALCFVGQGHRVEIDWCEGSLLDLAQLLPLASVDLVMANAVFDLFSERQFRQLALDLHKAGTPLLFTLNYAHMAFQPARPQDEQVIGWYDSHMLRPQSFGQAMGPAGGKKMETILREIGYEVQLAESIWDIRPHDQAMLGFMLGFMEGAIGELPLSEAEQQSFAAWLQESRQRVQQSSLALAVHHWDLWAKRG
jgi:SAM-dependent methyltransferase